MGLLRLCLKDKSSVLVKADMNYINIQSRHAQFIEVINYNTGKKELYNKDYIWCVRLSSQEETKA